MIRRMHTSIVGLEKELYIGGIGGTFIDERGEPREVE